MTSVLFKIGVNTRHLVFNGAEMSSPVEIEIFFNDLRTKVGGTAPWREQQFVVACPGNNSVIIPGSLLCDLVLAECKLPPHKDQPKRACDRLPTMPWTIRALQRSTPEHADQPCTSAAETTLSTGNANLKSSSKDKLPFGIFIRAPIRDVLRDLPQEIKKWAAIQELLTADRPGEHSRLNWAPHNSAMNKRQADALRRAGAEVRHICLASSDNCPWSNVTRGSPSCTLIHDP